MDLEEGQIGFAKYTGKLVEDGYLDARKSAQALIGFDEAVRFFIFQQYPDLRLTDLEFPVRIKKGSWEIVVAAIVGAYGVKAAQKMAENDFKDVGLVDLFKKSLSTIQWVLKIGKHMGDLTIKRFENAKFKDNNQLIGIRNSEGEFLYVPKEFLDYYVNANPSLLKKLSELVEDERTLSIGVVDGETVHEETLTTRHRRIFSREVDEEDDRILPELKHGENVTLEAEITRGNEMSNTIGIEYGGHIIIGYPKEGSIVKFKSNLFLKCRVFGSVTREDDESKDAKRPKIIVSRIEPIEVEAESQGLFDDNI